MGRWSDRAGAVSSDDATAADWEAALDQKAEYDFSYALGVSAVVYGWAPVMMDVARVLQTSVVAPQTNGQAPLNQFGPITRLWDWRDRSYTTANNDTLYLQAWLDLAEGPMVIEVPPIPDRYWIVQVVDMYTESVVDVCNATVGNHAEAVAIALEGSSEPFPADVPVHRSRTPYVWLAGRLGVTGPADVPAAVELQRQFRLTPLAHYPDGPAPPEPIEVEEAPEVEFPQGIEWFHRLDAVLRANPLDSAAPVVDQLAAIGIGSGRRLTDNQLGALNQAFIDGSAIIRDAAMFSATPVNGWNWEFNAGRYGHDYLARAAINMNSIGLNVPERAIYPKRYVDDQNEQLHGARTYTWTVPAEMPVNVEVGGFWSVTMYDAVDRFMVENELGRQKIGSMTDHLVRNDDGSLTIHISYERPTDTTRAANWLPAPQDEFMLQVRLYEPEPHVLDGTYELPQVIRTD